MKRHTVQRKCQLATDVWFLSAADKARNYPISQRNCLSQNANGGIPKSIRSGEYFRWSENGIGKWTSFKCLNKSTCEIIVGGENHS
jgi:hypothetical protein